MDICEKFLNSSNNLRDLILNCYGHTLYNSMIELANCNKSMQLLWLLTDAWAHLSDFTYQNCRCKDGYIELKILVLS